MSATSERREGNFGRLRERHLPLFNHNRIRGQQKAEHADKPDKAPAGNDKPKPRAWKRFGIVHFPAHDED